MTQKEQVLGHIEKNGFVTALDGFHFDPPVTSVHSRISDLRADGYEIETKHAPAYTDEHGVSHKGYYYYVMGGASS